MLDLRGNGVDFDAVTTKEGLLYLDLRGNTYKTIAFTGTLSFAALDYVDGVDYSGIPKYVSSLKMANCPLKKRVEMNDIFSGRIEYISAEDYDGFVRGKILERRGKILPNFGFEFYCRTMDV